MAKRPHIAFEGDLIACHLAASCTAEIKTKQGEREGKDEYGAWIDSSNGAGEIETDDNEYGYFCPSVLTFHFPPWIRITSPLIRVISTRLDHQIPRRFAFN